MALYNVNALPYLTYTALATKVITNTVFSNSSATAYPTKNTTCKGVAFFSSQLVTDCDVLSNLSISLFPPMILGAWLMV